MNLDCLIPLILVAGAAMGLLLIIIEVVKSVAGLF